MTVLHFVCHSFSTGIIRTERKGGDSDHTFIFAWKTIPNASFFSWGHGCNGPGAFYQVHTGGVGRTERALGRVNRAMLAEKEEAVEVFNSHVAEVKANVPADRLLV